MSIIEDVVPEAMIYIDSAKYILVSQTQNKEQSTQIIQGDKGTTWAEPKNADVWRPNIFPGPLSEQMTDPAARMNVKDQQTAWTVIAALPMQVYTHAVPSLLAADP